ncbi:MAG: cysteine desulfurase [Balneolales bacterium]|nr:cysteine desulfurase [Balneolales bacterium]
MHTKAVNMQKPASFIYLDNASTTKTDPLVAETMIPYLTEVYGNASSIHQPGRVAQVAVEESREKIARVLQCEVSEIIFTSGATESNNAAIAGLAEKAGPGHIITSLAEHHAVLHPLHELEKKGYSCTYLKPGPGGVISASQVEEALQPDTIFVSLMLVNNETGGITPVHEIASLCQSKNIPLHSDTVQAAGKIRWDVQQLGVDLLSLSSHKFHGPKGCGILYVKAGSPWSPFLQGGSQERNRRGGTLNVAGIAGTGKAMEILQENFDKNLKHVAQLSQKLISGLQEALPGIVHLNRHPDPALSVPHIVNCSFPLPDGKAIDGEMLLLNLDIEGICVSNGSACTSGAIEPSHVLQSLGLDSKTAKSSIRFSLSKFTTTEEIDYVLAALPPIIRRMAANA